MIMATDASLPGRRGNISDRNGYQCSIYFPEYPLGTSLRFSICFIIVNIPACTGACCGITTHLLSIERCDWSKQQDTFLHVRVTSTSSVTNLPLFVIYCDVVARIESRCVIKEKHALLQY